LIPPPPQTPGLRRERNEGKKIKEKKGNGKERGAEMGGQKNGIKNSGS